MNLPIYDAFDIYNDDPMVFESRQSAAENRAAKQNRVQQHQALIASRRAGKLTQRAARHPTAPQVQAGQFMPSYVPGMPTSYVAPGQPSCGGTCYPNTGWLGPAVTYMANNRKFAMSLSRDNQVFLPGTQPINLAHGTPIELARAMAIAVQGRGNLTDAGALWAAADLTLNLAGTTAFGVVVRFLNSYLNFKFGVYEIVVLNNAIEQSRIKVKIARIPAEFIILSIQNNNGTASVVPNQIPTVQFIAANNPFLVNASDGLYAQSLNMKDLGDVVQ
jgi:hypothetical protein